MKQVSIITRIEGGQFKRNKKLIRKAIETYKGKEVELIIKRRYAQRSLQQNKFYWGVIIPMFEELILEAWEEIRSKEEIHELLKATCNYKEKVNETTGEIIRVPKSSTELSTIGWLEYE